MRAALVSGGDVNSIGQDGSMRMTALMFAVLRESIPIVKLLLQQPTIDVNKLEVDSPAGTALHGAVSLGNIEIVQLLIIKLMADQRVDVNCKTGIQGSTPLHIVERKGYRGYTPLQLATLDGQVSLVQLFLANQRVDVNCCNREGITPLHEATGKGHVEAVRMLLADRKLDMNIKDQDNLAAVHYAAFHDQDVVMQLLLSDPRLTSVNDVNIFGEAPVVVALVNNSINSLRLLLHHPSVNLDKLKVLARKINCHTILFAENLSQDCGTCGPCRRGH